MATYVPAQLIAPKIFGSGSANIATWRKQNTVGAGSFDIHRTLVATTTSTAGVVTIEQGPNVTSCQAQRILTAYPLTQYTPYIANWWVAVPNNDYFQGFAGSTDVQGGSWGYTYS